MYRLTESLTNDITGGEISITAPGKMDTKYSLLLQNLYIKDNKIRKIWGYKPIHTNKIATAISSGIEFAYGPNKQVYVGGKGTIYRLVGDNLLELYQSPNFQNSTKKIHFVQMTDKVVAVNGDDVVCYIQNNNVFDKKHWTLLDNFLPSKPFIFKNRVWYINSLNKMEAMHSALQDPIKIEGYIDFSSVLPQSDELIDIKGYLDFICFIFKNHIVVYSGNVPTGQDADFALYQIINLPGILSSETNLNVENSLYLATKTGIKNLAMVYPSTKIVVNDFSQINNPAIMTMLQVDADENYYTCGYWPKENMYIWCFGRNAVVFNGVYKAFSRIVFPEAKCQFKGCFNDIEGNLNVLAGGYLHQYGNDYQFNGEDFLPIWKTAWIPLHPYGATCFPRYAELIFGASKCGGSVDIQAQVFNGNAVSFDYAVGPYDVNYDTAVIASKMDQERNYTWEEDFYMDSYSPIPLRIALQGVGKYIALTISEKETVRGLEFTSVGIFSERSRK